MGFIILRTESLILDGETLGMLPEARTREAADRNRGRSLKTESESCRSLKEGTREDSSLAPIDPFWWSWCERLENFHSELFMGLKIAWCLQFSARLVRGARLDEGT